MAKQKYFSLVPEKGFLSVRETLKDGKAWAAVDAQAIISGAQPITTTQPKDVLWKTRLLWSVSVLSNCLGLIDPQQLKEAEEAWENAQQRLHYKTELDARDTSPAIREAALRARNALLSGNGLAQNNLPFDEEVDFGRTQVELSQGELLSQDIAALNLQPFLDDIRLTTKKLAAVLGITDDTNRDVIRSIQIRKALDKCRATFRTIIDDIDWHLSCDPSPEEAKILNALRAPLAALHDRYTQPNAKEKPAAPPA